MTYVQRSFDADVEIRAGEDAERLRVVGHAAVFDQQTLIGSRRFGFVEKIARGAFDNVLDNDVRFLINHAGMTLARTKNETLRLSTDKIGLVSDADLNPDMQVSRDLYAAIKREDVDQMSFAFTILEDDVRVLPEDDPNFPGMRERTVLKVGRLFDNSAVTFPAYEGADIGARSTEINRTEIESVLARSLPGTEETLRDGDSAEDTESEDSESEVRSSKDDELLARLIDKRATRRGKG